MTSRTCAASSPQCSPARACCVASVLPEEAPDYWQNVPLSRQLSQGIRLDRHLPALLLIERRAYWPFLFDNPSQQPMTTLPPYRELAERADLMPGYRALAVPGEVDLCGYDELLLLEAGGEPDLAALRHGSTAAAGKLRHRRAVPYQAVVLRGVEPFVNAVRLTSWDVRWLDRSSCAPR